MQQRSKVYVQDLIRDQAKRVFDTLSDRQGLFYVCGYGFLYDSNSQLVKLKSPLDLLERCRKRFERPSLQFSNRKEK